MVCEGTRTLAATSRSSGPPFQSRVVGIARGRNDDAFGVHVDRVRRHAGIAAAEIEMVRHGAGEGDDAAVDEDRREDEDVLQMLAAAVGVVVDVEIAGPKLAGWALVHAGPENLRHRAQMHGDQLGLGNDIAQRVEQRGGCVLRLAYDIRIGRADELGAHLASNRDQGLGDNGIVDGVERQRSSVARTAASVVRSGMVTAAPGWCCRCRRAGPSTRRADRGSRLDPRSAPGPRGACPGERLAGQQVRIPPGLSVKDWIGRGGVPAGFAWASSGSFSSGAVTPSRKDTNSMGFVVSPPKK